MTVPALILLLGFTATEASGTSLVVVALLSAGGAFVHARSARVSWRAGFGFAAFGLPASALGGWLAVWINDLVLTVLLVVLLVASAVWMWRRKTPKVGTAQVSWVKIGLIGTGVGLLTGTLGVGGGFMVVPALAGLVGLPVPVAIGTSQVILLVNAVAGLVGRAGTEDVHYLPALVLAGGGLVGVLVSATLVGRIKPHVLTRLFATMLVVVAVALAGILANQLINGV